VYNVPVLIFWSRNTSPKELRPNKQRKMNEDGVIRSSSMEFKE